MAGFFRFLFFTGWLWLLGMILILPYWYVPTAILALVALPFLLTWPERRRNIRAIRQAERIEFGRSLDLREMYPAS